MNDTGTEPELERPWFFTFGQGHTAPNSYVRIVGTFMSARREMMRRYDRKWSHQYDEHEFASIAHHFPHGELKG